jgi:hypothetical protein
MRWQITVGIPSSHYTPLPSRHQSKTSLTLTAVHRPPGLIPRDGRNISFRELSAQIRSTYNVSPSFSVYIPRYIAKVLNRSYNTGRVDLSDIDVHNGIEHDASLVRK